MQSEFDQADRVILELLQRDGRITLRALGRAAGLSGPAVAERVRRLEDRGVIRGYRAEVAPEALGLVVTAFVSVGLPYEPRATTRFESQLRDVDAIVECHRITGEDRYLLKVVVPDLAALQEVVDRLRDFGRVQSWLVLSTLKRDAVLRPGYPTSPAPTHHEGAD
ncbi:MAG: Lrp/AsnC family transcriptional regulator, leucine-responsive regulatory protein [Chloroflexota bacterium]|jgi:Lrp/AsnC family leucine-responsive transcriptional regulator|nr:Lrp/AsnC family transcriptional regulator, leucine-responsive regulatory protein [Chloroflexota bacterium]